MNSLLKGQTVVSILGLAALVTLTPVIGIGSQWIAPATAAEVGSTSTLVSDAKTTAGSVQIVEENGKRYLELGDNFTTGRGPDVFVLLHRQSTPSSYDSSEFVNLGRIQRFNGSQRYEIPADVNLSEYQSVVIWCRAFNVTFGHGQLSV